MDILIPLASTTKTIDWSDDAMTNFTLTGAYRADFQYRPDPKQEQFYDRREYITKYQHFFSDERKCGIHRFTKSDGTVFEECEESIGTLIIYTED